MADAHDSPAADVPDHADRSREIAVISGGVGAARFLRGLRLAVDDEHIVAIVNTGDDTVLHGLAICPDLDTIAYTLADAIDPDRGWGLRDETWRAMQSLDRYQAARPEGSNAAPTWFNLGDQDLATHFYRTARIAEGATLTEVTDEIRRAWGLGIRILPMSDDRQSTVVSVTEPVTDEAAASDDTITHDVSFQDYFVRLRHGVPVHGIRFDGDAQLSASSAAALRTARVVVIAPSNPLVSIGPIRHLPGVDDLLASRRDSVVAVSPIVGGAALKGPADRMLTELGFEASVVGVARLYAPIASTLVIDPADRALAAEVEAAGMRCVVTPSIMSTPDIARSLAEATVAAAR